MKKLTSTENKEGRYSRIVINYDFMLFNLTTNWNKLKSGTQKSFWSWCENTARAMLATKVTSCSVCRFCVLCFERDMRIYVLKCQHSLLTWCQLFDQLLSQNRWRLSWWESGNLWVSLANSPRDTWGEHSGQDLWGDEKPKSLTKTTI